MVGKKLLGVIMSLSLVLGSAGSYGRVLPGANTSNPTTAIESSEDLNNGTVDLAIANDEKLIEMLKKSGKIAKDASPAQAEKALKDYLKSMENDYKKSPNKLTSAQVSGLKQYKQEAVNKGFLKADTSKLTTKNVSSAEYTGKVTKDKILVLLMEFPDLKHNTLTKDDTDNYYTDYTKQHYQDMIFGKDGCKGPNGETLISMKQFYDQQSGGSYDIEGNVMGWYMATNPAKYYGADSTDGSNHNVNVRALIKEALVDASKEANLADYDLEDPYDLDGDGNINEPDGIIDHLMVIHSGMGQEAGGGAIGADSIWSHSSKVYSVVDGKALPWQIPGTTMSAFPYTIMPEDGASGVFVHEFGHDLGLPDEYDTQYTGAGEPIEYWSIMSSGSWVGKIPGAEPIGFSPYAKEYFQGRYGGNWQSLKTVALKDITSSGTSFVLDQASIKGSNADAVKVTLPQKETTINVPASGTYSYFSGKGDDVDNSMVTSLDLTNIKSAKLTFKTWYDIEKDWDYASIKVKAEGETKFTSIAGNITTTTNPNEQNPGNGITGSSDGKWVDAAFDLSAYAGKKIDLQFSYWTDGAATYPGFYVDDINVVGDGSAIFTDNADATPKLTLNGFKVDNGKVYSNQYYLLEWRNHTAADAGLANIKRGLSLMSYDPGLLIWYVDDYYTDNWTGPVANGGHPGNGYLGLVDADQTINKWSDGAIGTTRYQMHDAAFSIRNSQKMFLDYGTKSMTDNNTFMHPFFDDSRNYLNGELPDAGRNVPKLGLKVYVTSEAKDRSSASIVIKK
ncbi:immune inhibitor A [Clostridium omnivorum]|uniref:Protease n=1 Tax=Clostridium omnivorum TaxID=1604902 RepID=A0ABQ5N0X7_9CLOT|nr:immune inhibitor A [Clostridium sp. E14]GLC28850.1 protease [Clostridium sp. E14]